MANFEQIANVNDGVISNAYMARQKETPADLVIDGKYWRSSVISVAIEIVGGDHVEVVVKVHL